MSFTSRRGAQRAGRPARRDRNGLVGLSGWLFADLLLGVAVIFLVGSEVPQRGSDGEGKSFGVRIETVDETVEKSDDAWEVQNQTFKLTIIFEDDVRTFGVEDIRVTGEADQWVASFFDDEDSDGAGKEFGIELTPKSGLGSGTFTVEIPADVAFRSDGSGNRSTSQAFTVVTCFPYSGIDTSNSSKIELMGAADSSVANLTKILEATKEIQDALGKEKLIGFMIIFGSGPDGDKIAKRNKTNLVKALSDLGLVPSGATRVCGQSRSEDLLPTLEYKEEGLGQGSLSLRPYFLTKTGN